MSENIKVEDFFGSSNNKLVIANTFAIYHHDWDAIGEAIQNAVDSVLKKAEDPPATYIPTIDITYNLRGHELIVRDNGLGIASDEMKRIVAPHVSLKDRRGPNRGEFGVGLTLVAFASNDFSLESVNNGEKTILKIMNGYSWAMDDSDKEDLQIVFDSKGATQENSYTKVHVKPLRFREYSVAQLVYTLRRYTALGDFWSCVNGEEGRIKATLRYLDANGKETVTPVQNSLWHAGDNLSAIDQQTVDWVTVEGEIRKPKDHTLPNWIGYGLTDKGTLTASNKNSRTMLYSADRVTIGNFPNWSDIRLSRRRWRTTTTIPQRRRREKNR